MNILVTGAAGFVGKNLCSLLLSIGHTVIALDNFKTSSKNDLDDLLKQKSFQFFRRDIVEPLPEFFNRLEIEQIYHLACPTGVSNVIHLGEEMLLTSSIGTKNILDFAKKKRSTIVFTSSSEVYGNPLVSPQGEDYTGNVDPTGIRSTYEEGKRFAEALAVWYARRYKLNAKIVRLFNTYGPGMNLSDTRVIPTFIKQALRGDMITIQGDGHQKRTFCYVDDTIKALMTVMEKGKAGEVYNIGSTQEITIRELAQLIKKITYSNASIRSVPRPSHDHEHRMPKLMKVQQLGWRFTTSLQKGLILTLQKMQSREGIRYNT